MRKTLIHALALTITLALYCSAAGDETPNKQEPAMKLDNKEAFAKLAARLNEMAEEMAEEGETWSFTAGDRSINASLSTDEYGSGSAAIEASKQADGPLVVRAAGQPVTDEKGALEAIMAKWRDNMKKRLKDRRDARAAILAVFKD